MPHKSGLTLTLTDAAGTQTASTDWQEAAERLARWWAAGKEPDAHDYARAHRILQMVMDVAS